MKKVISMTMYALIASILTGCCDRPRNYSECILENMPVTPSNNLAVHLTELACKDLFPAD